MRMLVDNCSEDQTAALLNLHYSGLHAYANILSLNGEEYSRVQ